MVDDARLNLGSHGPHPARTGQHVAPFGCDTRGLYCSNACRPTPGAIQQQARPSAAFRSCGNRGYRDACPVHAHCLALCRRSRTGMGRLHPHLCFQRPRPAYVGRALEHAGLGQRGQAPRVLVPSRLRALLRRMRPAYRCGMCPHSPLRSPVGVVAVPLTQ